MTQNYTTQPAETQPQDYYELLQVSPTAEIETIHRVYRLLAQRFHPDNRETGNASRFRAISEAYNVLSNAEERARYDIVHAQQQKGRWKLVSTGSHAENDFEIEQSTRLTVLEVLYTKRRMEPSQPAIYAFDLEEMIGRPREHLEFTIWYLASRKYIARDDNSRILITVDGVDHLETNYRANTRLRLKPAS